MSFGTTCAVAGNYAGFGGQQRQHFVEAKSVESPGGLLRRQSTASIVNADIIKVYLADGTFKSVRVDSFTTVGRIIDVVLDGVGMDRVSSGHFALRLNAFSPAIGSTSGGDSDDCHWLHPALRMPQVRRRYLDGVADTTAMGRPRFELRIRFIRSDLHEMYQCEFAAFLYLYEQLTADYLRRVAWRIDETKAFEMAALMLRKRFPNLNSLNIEKKLDFSVVEREGGLAKYLPEALIIRAKRKHLQRTLVVGIRRILALTEVDCVFRFMQILAGITPFDTEVFRAAIGPKWQDPLDLHVGHRLGIAYYSEKNMRAHIQLAALESVTEISVHRLNLSATSRTLVRLRLTANPTPLTVTLPTLNIAESFAHLIDGYRMMIFGDSMCTSYGDIGSAHGCGNSNAINSPPFSSSAWKIEGEDSQLSPLLADCSLILSPKATRRQISRNLDELRVENGSALSRLLSPHRRRAPTKSGGLAGRRLSSIFDESSEWKMEANNEMDEKEKPMEENAGIGVSSGDCLAEMSIDRRAIRLEELLGDGQFGNVYRGVFYAHDRSDAAFDGVSPRPVAVAVKVCKADNELCDTPTANYYLLEEARIMAQFPHPHIIRLLGVCHANDDGEAKDGAASTTPPAVWIVMELAAGGELRGYLQRERATVDLRTQVLFAHQLASALAFLHARQHLHRDVAARNCLVAGPRCVKLSDFGLSRRLDESEEIYTASHGKLPIKWLPPESINYRRFSQLSDVYMFGICVWEIFAYGVKPWQGVRNHEVIERVERGERLRRPVHCPEAVYRLLMSMWSAEQTRRPQMTAVEIAFAHIYAQLMNSKLPPEQLKLPPEFCSDHVQKEANNDVDSNTVLNRIINRDQLIINNNTTTSNTNNKTDVPPSFEAVPILPSSPLHMDQEDASMWRAALERQRIQCDEDDRWLVEEEEKLLPVEALKSRSFDDDNTNNEKCIEKENNNGYVKSNNKYGCAPMEECLPRGMELDRFDDVVHSAVLEVIRLIGLLSKRFSSSMADKELLANVLEIESATRRLLTDGQSCMDAMEQCHQVRLLHRLVESDLRQLCKAADIIEGEVALARTENTESHSGDFQRREVLRFAHILAVNSKHLLDSFDVTRLRAGSARLKPISNDN